MLSHACASCGKVLDECSRTYSGTLRMWTATCPRCGFAVRWCPRAAREPARIWSRLRALNLRLGVALAGIQFGGALLLVSGGILEQQLTSASFVRGASLASSLSLPGILAAMTGLLIGAGAAAMAPSRRMRDALLATWLAVLVFSAALWLTVLILGTSAVRAPDVAFNVLLELSSHPIPTAIIVGLMLLTSVVAANSFRRTMRFGLRRAVRRAARMRRHTLAFAARALPSAREVHR